MEKEPITVSGLQNLKAELEDLKNIQRPKIVEAIAEARSHGDLKENAEYHAAKEQQALIESRVIAINDIIARANVIDVTKIENNGKVIFGSTVQVQDLETGNKILKIKIPIFPIDGETLKQKGMREGQMLGNVLKTLEKEWINNNFKISSERVEEIIKVNSN